MTWIYTKSQKKTPFPTHECNKPDLLGEPHGSIGDIWECDTCGKWWVIAFKFDDYLHNVEYKYWRRKRTKAWNKFLRDFNLGLLK